MRTKRKLSLWLSAEVIAALDKLSGAAGLSVSSLADDLLRAAIRPRLRRIEAGEVPQGPEEAANECHLQL